MDSFPMSVANNLCGKLLPKYLDSKTVLIYCPHPVLEYSDFNKLMGFTSKRLLYFFILFRYRTRSPYSGTGLVSASALLFISVPD